MVCKVQRPISIPEPVNDVDSLWRTTQVLKEAVEVMQGIRGNREYALKCDLDDINTAVTNISVVSTPGESSGLEFGGAQYDMLYNTDGTTWGPSNGELQWNPSSKSLQLNNDIAISWLNGVSYPIKFLSIDSDEFTVGDSGYAVSVEASSVNMLNATPIKWTDSFGGDVEFLNLRSDEFLVGSVFYPTRLEGTLVGLRNSIGVNWDTIAGDPVELLVLNDLGTAPSSDWGSEPSTDWEYGALIAEETAMVATGILQNGLALLNTVSVSDDGLHVIVGNTANDKWWTYTLDSPYDFENATVDYAPGLASTNAKQAKFIDNGNQLLDYAGSADRWQVRPLSPPYAASTSPISTTSTITDADLGFSTASDDSTGVFTRDGAYFLAMGEKSGGINHLRLFSTATPFVLTGMTYLNELNINSTISNSASVDRIHFADDGKSIWLPLGTGTQLVYLVTMTVAFDLTTGSFTGSPSYIHLDNLIKNDDWGETHISPDANTFYIFGDDAGNMEVHTIVRSSPVAENSLGSRFIVGDPATETQIDGLTTNITSASTDIDGTLNVDGAAVLQDTLKIKGITEADSFVRLGADITTATPPTTETPTSQLQFWDIDYTDQIGAVGYFAGNIFGLRNEMWNGPAQFEYRDSAGTLKDYLQAYPNANTNIKAVGQVDLYVNDGALGLTAKNGGVDIYVNNNLKAEFGTQGLDIHSATNADNAVNIVRFSWLNGTDRGFVGYSATDDLYVLNQVTNGSVIITPNGTGVVNVTGAVDLDSTLNVDGISTLNNDLAITTTLDDATGDEVALSLDYTTNKATSGADTGFQMTMTDTLSPGASLFADYRLGAVTLFDWGIDGTYRIYDATGADSAAFSHDGTDFNTSFVNTTDWNLNNITNVDIHDGGALRLFHTDNTSSYTMSRNAATVTFESSVTSDNLEFLGHQQIRFNKNTAGNTQFFIGEDSTIYGSNSTAYLELWGEQSSTKYALRMQVNSDTAVFASIGAGAIDQVLFGTAIWANNNIEVHDGSSLVIYNSTDNDSADFSHDGIDFNTVFTNTTDWNVTGLAGFNVANYSFDVDQTVGAGQDNFVLTYDDVSGLISLEAAGGGGIGGSITDNQVAVGATTADDIEGSANLTWDGTDLDVTGGITVSGDAIFSQLASGSTATMVLTNNQPRLDIIDDNAAANTGIWSFANVAGNFRLTPFSDAYSAGNNAIQITRSGNNANIGSLQANARWEVVNNTDFWVRDGAELVILDSSDADSATFSHDGTDFNTAFTNTTDWNITSLTSIQAGTVDADFDVVTATNVSTDGYLQLRTATDTELNAIANAINTDAGKIQGAVVYNTTTDNPVYATGNTDGAVWVDGAGTTVNTPV